MNKTKIEWADYTSNPIKAFDGRTGKRGWFCTKCSPGCAHCYAERINIRFGNGLAYTAENERHVAFLFDDREWVRILRSRAPAGSRVFVGDMCDLFHPMIPEKLLDRVWASMAYRLDLTFIVLTKRAERMRAYLNDPELPHRLIAAFGYLPVKWSDPDLVYDVFDDHVERHRPLPNVWVGVSAEDQQRWEERVEHLRKTTAAVRLVSVEPMLDPISIHFPGGPLPDWVICGGETGPGARPIHPDLIRSLRNQCLEAGIPFFLKRPGGPGSAGRELDGRLWEQYPEPPERGSGMAESLRTRLREEKETADVGTQRRSHDG